MPKREIRKSPSTRFVSESLKKKPHSVFCSSLWTVYESVSRVQLSSGLREGRVGGNGLLSEYSENRHLIGHLNEVPSRDQREKWSFSTKTVFRNSNEKSSRCCLLRGKLDESEKKIEKLNIPLWKEMPYFT